MRRRMITPTSCWTFCGAKAWIAFPRMASPFNTKTGEITTQNTPEALEIFRQVIEQLNRPDGKCASPEWDFIVPSEKVVVITGQFLQDADCRL